jgi:hypothetical protein
MTFGPDILARTLSVATRRDRHGNLWQYHSRSDHHSKVACWGILFDLMISCPTFRRHVEERRVAFGINHEMRSFETDRKKNLDLVICTPGNLGKTVEQTFADLADQLPVLLSPEERVMLDAMPSLRRAPVSSVLLALEAKACMTAHQRALPRLYDELNSSHATVHGAADEAIAAGFVMVNRSATYLSPDLNKRDFAASPEWSRHTQPRDAEITVAKVRQLPRRVKHGEVGYDALAIVVVDMANDGSPVELVSDPPAPAPGDIHHYDAMIARLSQLYGYRFKDF